MSRTLRARLAEAEETLRAIGAGEVDAVVIAGKHGPRVFTLEGAEHAYRVLIESMNEGALTLAADKTILYANECFARMVRRPLEQVIGAPFGGFLSDGERTMLRPLVRGAAPTGSKLPVELRAADGSRVPVQLSIRPLAKDGTGRAAVGVVVTDLTDARRNEERLRALSQRLVQVQEAERGRVALELHDDISQLLCAVLLRCQALTDKLSERNGAVHRDAVTLRDMIGEAVGEVERISRNLRPSVLDQLGLAAVVRVTGREFAARTGVPLQLSCMPLEARLPVDIEVTLYRILQEALRNVEEHARARQVTVRLHKRRDLVELVVRDDGVGFDTGSLSGRNGGNAGLGLLGMRERATHVGGTFTVTSVLKAGT
jgi:PAS domain S-box-containing protein